MSFKYEVTQQSTTFGDGKVRVIAGFDHESDAAAFASLSRSTYVGVEFEVRPFTVSEEEWEIPYCRIDDGGSVEHSVNCECWGPSDRPKLKRRKAGPFVPVEDAESGRNND